MPDQRASDVLPCIRRARGFRLYDASGRRYLDLHREGALLGHRFGLTVMKSVLSQGLAASMPNAWEGRLAGAISRMIPSHPVARLFASADAALAAAGRYLGARLSWGDVPDPAFAAQAADGAAAGAALWRPFLPAPRGARVLLPVLPLTVAGCPAAACFPAEASRDAPPSERLPAFLCAAALQACAALQARSAAGPAGRASDGREPAFAADALIERAIDGAPRRWARTGPYVRAVFPEAEYARVRAAFLRSGVLLHPGYPGPSVLPGECSPGESRLLADLFAGAPGG